MDACPPEEEVADYYNTLTAPFDVVVRHIDENRGKGCFAKVALERRAVVFRDRALVQLQSRKQTSPRPGVAAWYPRSLATCEHCCRFVGSLWLQLALLGCGEALHLDAEMNTQKGVLHAQLPPGADFTLPFISPEDATLTAPVFTHRLPSGALLCYCSERCRLEAEGRSLELSKVGPLADMWERFKQYADATGNRFFILAALIVQAVVHQLQTNGGDLAKATRPYRFMVKRPYWETIDLPEGEDAASLRREIESQTETSFGMLEQLFAEDLHRYPALRSEFVTLQTYSALLGGLNLNTITIKVPSPLVSYFLMLDSMPSDSKQTAVLALRPLLLKLVGRVDAHDDVESEDSEDDEEEAPRGEEGENENENEEEGEGENEEEGEGEDESEGEDDPGEDDEFEFNWQDVVSGDSGEGTLKFTSSIFPPFKGYAFFPLLSTLNHSCEPNCQVAYLEDGEAVVFALRDIEVGEELTISYIYQHLPLAARQEQLRSYGFLCQCLRCLHEEPPALKRPSKKARIMQ